MLLTLLAETPEKLCGASVADKVVGKAAALLMAKGNVKEVYAEVVDESAMEIFTAFGIGLIYKMATLRILNRSKTDICPMERAVLGISDPTEAFKILTEIFFDNEMMFTRIYSLSCKVQNKDY